MVFVNFQFVGQTRNQFSLFLLWQGYTRFRVFPNLYFAHPHHLSTANKKHPSLSSRIYVSLLCWCIWRTYCLSIFFVTAQFSKLTNLVRLGNFSASQKHQSVAWRRWQQLLMPIHISSILNSTCNYTKQNEF